MDNLKAYVQKQSKGTFHEAFLTDTKRIPSNDHDMIGALTDQGTVDPGDRVFIVSNDMATGGLYEITHPTIKAI